MTGEYRIARLGLTLMLGGLICVANGCGDSRALELQEMTKGAVERGLGAWQRGDHPDSLKKTAEPLDFFDDDWQRGAKLVSFRVIRTFFDTDDLPKCAVELTVQSGDAAPVTQHVTYQAVKKPHVIVSRDPFN